MIGKRIIIIDAHIQFIAVEKGITFGWTISGMQSQTMGPKETPKTPMNIINPIKIKLSPKELFSMESFFR